MLAALFLMLHLSTTNRGAELAPLGPKILWSEPGLSTISDWIWGPGGESRAPRPPFQFVKENFGGTNPKIDVRDANGALWIVKFGGEVHTDTFAARLLHAVGFLAEPAYFVPAGIIAGVHDLKRAKPFVAKDGRFRCARFKLRDKNSLSYADEFQWSWTANPFLGSHELNGLKILIMLTSNWDTKDARDGEGSNTAVFVRPGSQPATYLYSFTDWGSSLGSWGGFLQRDKWNPVAYERQTRDFVKGVHNGTIVWGYSGKHGPDITEGIGIDDVNWLLPYLSRITDQELRAGLVASGASEANAGRFTRSIRSRIAQLQRIGGAANVAACPRPDYAPTTSHTASTTPPRKFGIVQAHVPDSLLSVTAMRFSGSLCSLTSCSPVSQGLTKSCGSEIRHPAVT